MPETSVTSTRRRLRAEGEWRRGITLNDLAFATAAFDLPR
jgi:hypothetical protein